MKMNIQIKNFVNLSFHINFNHCINKKIIVFYYHILNIIQYIIKIVQQLRKEVFKKKRLKN